MNESALYKELGILTKDKSIWEENIPYVTTSGRPLYKSLGFKESEECMVLTI